MKRVLPAIIAIGAGLVVLANFFVSNPLLNTAGQTLLNWGIILAAVALILGVLNLLAVHLRRIGSRENGWPYSIVLILSLVIVAGLGLSDPAGPRSPWMIWIFDAIQYPLQAALFALLAFFILSAAIRAFRVRRWESLFFIVAGVLVLIGATPLAQLAGRQFVEARDWILAVPALAGARGLIIGVALGIVITGLRVLMGMERPYAE